MSPKSFTEDQHSKVESLLLHFCKECELDAVAVCDTGGNILSSHGPSVNDSFDNAAALAAGSFAATRELASIIGENGFESIMHRGSSKGLLIKAVGSEYIIVIFLGTNSVEGMVRLILKKIAPQILSILESSDITPDSGAGDIEIKSTDS